MMQSNVFDYDNSNSPAVKSSKPFNILPPRNPSPPKFGEVVVQEVEDRDKSENEMYVPEKPASVYE